MAYIQVILHASDALVVRGCDCLHRFIDVEPGLIECRLENSGLLATLCCKKSSRLLAEADLRTNSCQVLHMLLCCGEGLTNHSIGLRAKESIDEYFINGEFAK